MSFKMVILPTLFHEDWPEKIRAAVPGAVVKLFQNPRDAIDDMSDANCAYGDVIPELFARAKKLQWIQAHMAGPPPSFYHEALVKSDVVVTNFRGIFNDIVSVHAMTLLLVLARRFHEYIPQQLRGEWRPSEAAIHLPDCTVLVIGVGGIGLETARLCHAFGMKVTGVDPRLKEKPSYLKELYPPKDLDRLLPLADFVIIATPETPETQGMINAKRFSLMKGSAFLVNVGRGACVVLDDLVEAIRSKKIAGAGLDVFETEPLPPDHPLWKIPGVIMTPHVAAHNSPQVAERRTHILIENCKRFARGQPLLNVVDKANRF